MDLPAINAADWGQPDKHQSKIVRQAPNHLALQRTLDSDQYFVALDCSNEASAQTETAHSYLLTPSKKSPRLEFVIGFSPQPISKTLPTARATFAASEAHWKRFWSTGGAVEFAESGEPRSSELERRVVLSQYLTAIQCAGSMPPQETGLTVNSWYGKFHLEMHWWHAAHFALWNRLPLLEKSLGWYHSILPVARASWRSLKDIAEHAGPRWLDQMAATVRRRLDHCSSGSSRTRFSTLSSVIECALSAKRWSDFAKLCSSRLSSWHLMLSTMKRTVDTSSGHP